MIPKIIHYCWYGRGQKNYIASRCVESYGKLNSLGDEFKIIEWTEENTDLSSPSFVELAYKKGAWAFVSDYVRLKALYECGGVYLDTDVEIIRNFDCQFWNASLIFGFMYDDMVSTAVIMAEPHHPFIKKLLDCYDSMNLNIKEANNILITEQLCKTYPRFLLNGKLQEFAPRCYIYPKYYFEEPTLFSRFGGYSVHHFMGSWQLRNNSLRTKLRPIIKLILFRCSVINWIYQKLNRRIYLKKSCFYQRYLSDKKRT